MSTRTATLWDVLVCPEDGQELRREVFDGPSERPTDGVLTCAAGHAYPIVSGIPRMVPDAMRQFPEFRAKYGRQLPPDTGANLSRAIRATRESYSSWWTKVVGARFYEEDARAWLRARTGLEPEFFRGRTVLDAGCGNGRLTRPLAEAGAALVVGMDLGAGAERAAAHSRHLPNAWFVQGNLLRPPFNPESFDSVMSIGVLHHTPTPRTAFASIARRARVGGTVSVYLYHRPTALHDRMLRFTLGQALLTWVQAPIHAVVTRLPHAAVLTFCRLLWWRRLAIEAVRRVSPRVAWLLEMIPPVDSYKPYEGRDLNVIRSYDYYSARYNFLHSVEEVLEWFREESLDGLVVTPYRVSVTGTRGSAPVENLRIELWGARSAGEVETILTDAAVSGAGVIEKNIACAG